jgi:glycine cleavage system T protein (aminomethyltransferase)
MTSPEPTGHVSPLLRQLEEAGGVVGDYHGRRLVRHFGDPGGEYAAATEGLAVFDRSHRSRLKVSGRSPAQMLNGIWTGTMPSGPTGVECGDEGAQSVVDERAQRVVEGEATYHAVLTPKGKMITDLVALRLGPEETVGFLLDVPVAGRDGLLAHFAKFFPPRFAKVEDVSDSTAAISVVGPKAALALSKFALGLCVDEQWLRGVSEGLWRGVGGPVADGPVTDGPVADGLAADGLVADGLVVVRTHEVWPEAWTVYGPAGAVAALWRALVGDGACGGGLGTWSTLRVEAGRPVFGTDMDEGTLPPEAGIAERAIDQTKGCYTGQEVIVRIRDRGHVNHELRRLVLGDVPAPARGTGLFAPDGSGKVVGEIRSAVESPRYGGAIALAYVRRGVAQVLLNDAPIDVPEGFPVAPSGAG